MSSTSTILFNAYQKYFLNLGNKKVPTPYRINVPYQDDRRKYGKWNASKLTHDTNQIAQEQGVDLNSLSVDEIRNFMKSNQLGIDCSGFAYQTLNFLLNKLKKGNLKSHGLPNAANTNVATLGSDNFSIPVKMANSRAGDMIIFNNASDGISHVVVILEKIPEQIKYIHSADSVENNGVQEGFINISDPAGELENQNWVSDPKLKSYYKPPRQSSGDLGLNRKSVSNLRLETSSGTN
jgi:hypothetical protein